MGCLDEVWGPCVVEDDNDRGAVCNAGVSKGFPTDRQVDHPALAQRLELAAQAGQKSDQFMQFILQKTKVKTPYHTQKKNLQSLIC